MYGSIGHRAITKKEPGMIWLERCRVGSFLTAFVVGKTGRKLVTRQKPFCSNDLEEWNKLIVQGSTPAIGVEFANPRISGTRSTSWFSLSSACRKKKQPRPFLRLLWSVCFWFISQLKGQASRLHNTHSRNHSSCIVFDLFRVRCFYIFTVTIGMPISWRGSRLWSNISTELSFTSGIIWISFVNHDWSTNLPPNLPPHQK